MKSLKFVTFCLLLLSACQVSPPDPIVPLPNQTAPVTAQAKIDLINFYVYLNHGKYDQANSLFGGSYEMLQGWNPDLDPEDYSNLLKRGCEQNGLQCLQLFSADLSDRPTEYEFIYKVTFRNPDNSQFVLGPCCGASEEEMPPNKVFEVHVSCDEAGSCYVHELPPYLP